MVFPIYVYNDPEVCDFMTNDRKYPFDIFKCSKCDDGFMVVKPGQNLMKDFMAVLIITKQVQFGQKYKAN